MKKFSWILLSAISFVFSSAIFISCKKINEATELGSGLIPAVDNVNTFDTTLEVVSNNTLLLHDSTRITYSDNLALGVITNDPVFGQTKADIYFDVLPQSLKTYPFFNKDSFTLLSMDSVVLSLAYAGAYGDTATGSLSVQVKEIAQSAKFNDTSVYRVSHPDFETTGVVLGTKTVAIRQLKDSFSVVSKGRDTTKVANVLRIPLNNLGQRFAGYDTTNAYKNDTLFHSLFSGFKIEANGTTNTLGYFQLSDQTKTKLTFYYRAKSIRTGLIDTVAVDFLHYNFGSQANIIQRTRSGDFAAYLIDNNPSDDKLFIQGGSPGSIATIKIPGLDNFANKVIHRAELIANKIPSSSEAIFGPPSVLFLDKVDLFDVGSSITDDLSSTTANGTPQSLAVFGGGLNSSDSTYRFNLTRHVQGIVTRKETNYLLRLYAPFYTIIKTTPEGSKASRVVYVNTPIASGRVVLAGGSYTANPAKKLRLRIIYSNIQ